MQHGEESNSGILICVFSRGTFHNFNDVNVVVVGYHMQKNYANQTNDDDTSKKIAFGDTNGTLKH